MIEFKWAHINSLMNLNSITELLLATKRWLDE